MCLMCEYYRDTCDVPECVERADPYDRYTLNYEPHQTIRLWRGYDDPCEHIAAKHGPLCDVIVGSSDPNDPERYCSCYQEDGEWKYYE